MAGCPCREPTCHSWKNHPPGGLVGSHQNAPLGPVVAGAGSEVRPTVGDWGELPACRFRQVQGALELRRDRRVHWVLRTSSAISRSQPGLVGTELTETVAHESVRRLLSPRATSLLGEFRVDVGMAAYNRSHLVRFLEEAAAETWATGSLHQGIAFPLREGYVTGTRVIVEGVGYVTIVGGTIYVGYRAVQENTP